MMLQSIPSAEHSRLVHSTNAIVDMTYLSHTVQAAALKQLENYGFTLAQMMGYVIRTVALLKNNRVINHPEEYKMFILNDIDHMLESDIIERHKVVATQIGYVTILPDALVGLVIDTLFKMYKTYNYLFCAIFTELSTTCSALGYMNCDFRIHQVQQVSPYEISIAIGCYM